MSAHGRVVFNRGARHALLGVSVGRISTFANNLETGPSREGEKEVHRVAGVGLGLSRQRTVATKKSREIVRIFDTPYALISISDHGALRADGDRPHANRLQPWRATGGKFKVVWGSPITITTMPLQATKSLMLYRASFLRIARCWRLASPAFPMPRTTHHAAVHDEPKAAVHHTP